MKINDILECINKTLDRERAAKKLAAKGHFVHYIAFEKQIGNIKTFSAKIVFVHNNIGTNADVVLVRHTCSCPTEGLEEMKEKVLVKLLEEFFTVLRFGKGKGDYENFVNGTFEGWS